MASAARITAYGRTQGGALAGRVLPAIPGGRASSAVIADKEKDAVDHFTIFKAFPSKVDTIARKYPFSMM
jgi:hypothetical protein